MDPPGNTEVEAVFAGYPQQPRKRLLKLRRWVFEVAEALPGVGPIHETLKWGEPAYLTPATKAGSTLRLGWKPQAPEYYSMFVHCSTSLVDSFRTLFPGLHCIGNREVRFEISEPVPLVARDCIALVLTYHKPHLRRKRNRRA
jgi:hypothetical protein